MAIIYFRLFNKHLIGRDAFDDLKYLKNFEVFFSLLKFSEIFIFSYISNILLRDLYNCIKDVIQKIDYDIKYKVMINLICFTKWKTLRYG